MDSGPHSFLRWATECPARQLGDCTITIEVHSNTGIRRVSYHSADPGEPPFLRYSEQTDAT
jgi:hypothetical protein